MNDEQPAQPWSRGFRAGVGTTLGFGVVALVHAVFIVIQVPRPATGIWIRVQHHFFDALGTIGLGVIAGASIGACISLVERDTWSKRWRWFLRSTGLLVAMFLTGRILLHLIVYELERISLSQFGGRFETLLFSLGALLLHLSVPGLYLLGGWGSQKRWVRYGLVLVSLIGLVMNLLHFPDDYAGVHGGAAWLCAACLAMPLSWWAEKAGSAWSVNRQRMFAGLIVSFGLFGLFFPPSNAVRAELFRTPAPMAAWIGAGLWWRVPGHSLPPAPADVASSPYFQPRNGLPPIPPTQPPLRKGRPPIVVLITIDATRADALDKAPQEDFFPALNKMKRTGAFFPHVTSPGSQTAVSLSTLFSGHYFSQLEWREHGRGALQFLYPATDRTPRFPELLAAQKITTTTFGSITFLSNEYGVTRGFSEETMVIKGRDHATAQQLIPPLLARLQKVANEPFFAYVHLTEPHAPYDRAGTEGPLFQRYLEEIRLADKYVNLVLEVFERRFADRGYLIVSSDHGEAFGEHGTTKHTKTLYEELLRVPLFIRGPGISPRTIEEHVTLVDLGPTILDLLGVDTPADFMGQSLVPLLAGRNVHLDRPILAEGRLRRVLYWGDLKVIDDPRRKVVEVYDLKKDPRELRNIFDTDRGRALPALAALRHFFKVHELPLEGYKTPYKP
jgi:Sulfatase